MGGAQQILTQHLNGCHVRSVHKVGRHSKIEAVCCVETRVPCQDHIDPQLYCKEDLATAFRCRWHAELNLRSIKQVMQMDVLRCKSPAMVRKEIWMHLLAYNLIRTLMAQAALAAGCWPRDISFKGTLQILVAFAMAGWSRPRRRNALYAAVLRAVATHRVNDRPDRIEPRAVKRRPKKLVYLNEPRHIAKARLLKGA